MGRKNLTGKTVAITRAQKQSSGLKDLLESFGARVIPCSTIKILPPRSFRPLDRAIRNLQSYDWLIFTSVNAVDKFAGRYQKIIGKNGKIAGKNSKITVRQKFPAKLKTCAIGPATAEKMEDCGFPVTKISKDYVAESILKTIRRARGQRILIPRAAQAREVLPKELARRGARVDVIEAYRTTVDSSRFSDFSRLLEKDGVDCVTFTSSSTVTNFFALLGGRADKVLKNTKIRAASIGPITTQTLHEHGWRPTIVAGKPTTRHLAEAIVNFYGKPSEKSSQNRSAAT